MVRALRRVAKPPTTYTKPPIIKEADVDLPVNCDKPTKEEIRRAIMKTKNGKAAGPDEIPAETLKGDINTTVEMFHGLFG